MGRKNVRSGKNFGWGKSMKYAGHNAIRTACSGGRFATVAAHSERWKHFCRWVKSQNICDVRDVSVTTLQLYAEHLVAEKYSASYAQNLLSSCNVVLEAMREDSKIKINPVEALGSGMRRSHVRDTAPETSLSVVENACQVLRKKGFEREVAMVELCRHFGLRSKEAAMLDCNNALSEQKRFGKINIVAGTKGGRGQHIDRWVPVSETALSILKNAAKLQGNNRNLIPIDNSCHKFLAYVRAVVTDVLKEHNIKSLHELRSVYACSRYEQITGLPAPCISGSKCSDGRKDLSARETITQELGHSRIDVVASYVGGRS